MTDWAVIGIITTMIMMSMMIIGVLITMFIYLIRRMDAMRREFSDEFKAVRQDVSVVRQDVSVVRQDVSALAERVARLEGIIIGRLEVGNGLTQTGDD